MLWCPARLPCIGSLAVLFAIGEFYCFRSDIWLTPSASLAAGELFASQVNGRIKYYCEAKPNNITIRRSRIILLRRSRNNTCS